MSEREYDIVLLGATGFTGQLWCEQALDGYQGKVRWAAAGRSESKLQAVLQRLSTRFPAAEAIPVLVVDATDQLAVDKLSKRTHVIASLAGPYALYGNLAVAACARNGTHWCDLSGEIPWIRRIISEHHEAAQRSGAKIVPSCAYNSMVADLGTYYMARHATESLKSQLASVELVVTKNEGGGLSGGTMASYLTVFDEPRQEQEAMQDPYALDPPGSQRGPDGRDAIGVQHNASLKCWTQTGMFHAVDNRTVRRSNALMAYAYGQGMAVSGSTAASSLPAALWGALRMAVWTLLARIPWIRHKVLSKWVRQAGEGPCREAMLAGRWQVALICHLAPSTAQPHSQPVLRGGVRGVHEGGYWDTATMNLEAAVCLATQGKELKEAGLAEGGVLTPASAMGGILIDRLQRAGFRFRIH